MGIGLQVFNEDGTVQFDEGSRLYRVLTIADTNGQPGSVTVSPRGNVRVTVQATNVELEQPEVTVNGGQVSWDYRPGFTRDPSARVYIAEY